MQGADQRLAYIVVDWGTAELALSATESIRRFRPESEIITVDARASGLGYSQALNAATASLASEADVVVCCNADIEMLQDDTPILEAFELYPRAGIIGPLQVNAERKVVHAGIVPHEGGGWWDLDLRHRCWLMDLNDAVPMVAGISEVPMVAGSVFYIGRETLRALGGWPEWTRAFYEDQWLCYRARQQGMAVMYCGWVTWRHLVGSSAIDEATRERLFQTARERFILECGRHDVPLRTWSEDDPLALARQAGAL